jgi:hypothetical protein
MDFLLKEDGDALLQENGEELLVAEVVVEGRTTKNTRAFPLGLEVGMNWRGAL